MALKVIIVDDEANAREILCEMLKKYAQELEVAAMVGSVSAAYDAILAHRPDVVFLDVRLVSETGFELLEKFEDIGFETIFTTAYDQYALKAIKFSAADYLLKPISPSDLKSAIQKVVRRKEREGGPDKESYRVLKENLRSSGPISTITVSTSEGLTFLDLKDIIRCEGNRGYTTFYTVSGKSLIVSKTLKEYESLLSEHGFLRIYQSHLVNARFIKKYNRGRNGTLEMSDGSVLPVSRERKNIVLKNLKGRLGW